MSKACVRTGTLDDFSKLQEQEELIYKKPIVSILREYTNGNYMEVFNSYTGLNVATLDEIEWTLDVEEKKQDLAKDKKSQEIQKKRVDILREARIEMLAKTEQAERELKKSMIPKGSENGLQATGGTIEQLMRPMLESMGRFMQQMSEAVEHIATAQDVMRNRMEALEKQSRLETPVTDRQARYLSDAAREKAAELLAKKDISEKKAFAKMAGIIRKAVLQRYGVGSLREIPRCEYSVALSQIESWNNARIVMEIASEAREREEKSHEAEPV